MFSRFFKEILSNARGFCVGRSLLVMGCLGAVALCAYSVFKGQPFNMNDYGIGYGALMGGGLGGIAAKDHVNNNVNVNVNPSAVSPDNAG